MRKYFDNMKIGRKLMAVFVGIIFLYSLTVGVAIFNIYGLSDRMSDLYAGPFSNVED